MFGVAQKAPQEKIIKNKNTVGFCSIDANFNQLISRSYREAVALIDFERTIL